MDSEFWGCVIPAGRAVRVEVATDEEYVHVSQAALGADARAGRTTVTLAVADDAEASGARDGARHALCALTRDACDQVGMDVALDASFVLRATGPNYVHVTGWRTANDGIDEEEEARTYAADWAEFPDGAAGSNRAQPPLPLPPRSAAELTREELIEEVRALRAQLHL